MMHLIRKLALLSGALVFSPDMAAAQALGGQRIAVVIVCTTGSCYLPFLQQLTTILRGAGATVTETVLSAATSVSATDLREVDQVWFADASANPDNAPSMLSSYTAIANWFGERQRHLIFD